MIVNRRVGGDGNPAGILRESCGNNHTVNLLSLLLFALSSSDYIIILFYSLLFDFALVPPPVPRDGIDGLII